MKWQIVGQKTAMLIFNAVKTSDLNNTQLFVQLPTSFLPSFFLSFFFSFLTNLSTKRVMNYKHSVTILARSLTFFFWYLEMCKSTAHKMCSTLHYNFHW
jgi:hypothetical protein